MKLLANNIIRWTSWSLLTVLFALSCVLLASWQWDRREQAVERVSRVYQNYDLAAVDYNDLKGLNAVEIAELEWRPVSISGEYLSEQSLLVRNRPVAAQPGFIQLIPLRLSGGEIVLIERGWISADSNLAPVAEFIPAQAQKEITGRLRLSELSPGRNSPAGQITSINLSELSERFGSSFDSRFYLRMVQESPPESTAPQSLGKPILDEGNHLSYAVQWVLFALMGFFALFWAIRQELRFRRLEKDPSYRPTKKSKPSDAEIEDELLDQSTN